MVSTDEFADLQRHVTPERGYFLTCLNGMTERLLRLLTHPLHDRNPGVPEHHERVLSKPDHPRQFKFNNLVQCFEDFFPVDLHDAASSSFGSVCLLLRRLLQAEPDFHRDLVVTETLFVDVPPNRADLKPVEVAQRLRRSIDCPTDCVVDAVFRRAHYFRY